MFITSAYESASKYPGVDLVELKEQFPVLASKLHSLVCAEHIATGHTERVSFNGDQLNGKGEITFFRTYGSSTRTFSIKNGTLFFLRRRQSMYKHVKYRTSSGWYYYSDGVVLTTKNDPVSCEKQHLNISGDIISIEKVFPK